MTFHKDLNRTVRLSDKIVRFIQSSQVLTTAFREELVGIIFEYFYNPEFDGKAVLARSNISKEDPGLKYALLRCFAKNGRDHHSIHHEQLSLKATENILIWLDENYDEITYLDKKNKYSDKIFKMTSLGGNKNITQVPDPYYRGSEGFEIVLDILEDSVEGLINKVEDDIRREN